jgi:hypothetical protein
MQSAFLIGPYLGELSWEILRLAPFVAHMKRVYEKKSKIIVLTRPSRFDLHGLNADVLIPLVLSNDREEIQDGHGIKGFDITDYDKLVKEVRKRLLSKYAIEEHFYFDLSEPFRRVKFQTMRGFNRAKLYYNFRPRPGNKRAVDLLVKDITQMIYIDTDVRSEQETELLKNYVVFDKSFFEAIRVGLLPDASFLGCCMELMKRCKFVIGSLEKPISLLALMLGIPLMIISENIREDEVKMLNPVHTPIIHCPNLERGLTIYETNF